MLNDWQLFLLVFFRVTGIMMLAPVFGSQMMPVTLKTFLSLVLAVLFFPLVPRGGVVIEPNLGAYVLAVGGELAVGGLIGFAAALIFAGVQFGGQLIDQELGLMMANVLDPISNEQISVIGQFKAFLAMIVYLLIDGHHFLISAASDSFRAVPLLGFSLTPGAAMHVSDALMRDLFRMAVQIAAPAMATLFLITIAMAFMARTVPEMNIFILGFSLRIAVGLAVLALGVGLFVCGFQNMSLHHDAAVGKLIGLMGG